MSATGESTPGLSAIDRMLTAQQVAEILQVTPRTVHRLAKAGRLERVRISYKVSRYRPESVAALIQSTTSEGPATSGTLAKDGDAPADRDRE